MKQEGKARERSQEKERDRGKEGEAPKPSRATDMLIGDEEQNKKQKKLKTQKQGASPNPSTMDPSAASYDPQGSYGDPIRVTQPPGPQGEYISIVGGLRGPSSYYSCFT